MKNQSGMTLVESIVAVGLSGVFIVMLSAMLAQTLQLMRLSQDELIAASAAELLIENSKNIPIEKLDSLSLESQPIRLIMNTPDTTSTPSIRPEPVQLDLENANKLFGVINGSTGAISTGKSWNKIRGNYFDGEATVEIKPFSTSENIKAYEVIAAISFKSPTASPSISYPRKIVRKTIILDRESEN